MLAGNRFEVFDTPSFIESVEAGILSLNDVQSMVLRGDVFINPNVFGSWVVQFSGAGVYRKVENEWMKVQ